MARRPRRRKTTQTRRRRRRRRNPTLALATNPTRRRRRARRRRSFRRRRNPALSLGGLRMGGFSLASVMNAAKGAAFMGAGAAGNLLLLNRIMPTWFRAPVKKYIALLGVPLLIKAVIKGNVGDKLFYGGLAAAGLHAANDYIPGIQGTLIPDALAYTPASTGAAGVMGLGYGDEGGLFGLGDYGPPQQIGAGDDDMAVEELEELVSGVGQAYEDDTSLMSGLGTEEEDQDEEEDSFALAQVPSYEGVGLAQDDDTYRIT